tara:strand:- start:66264 stop:67601 length:1338 start_codon:yes stop_codon:yes gene_type:complete
MTKKIYVLDTSVYLTNAESIFSFDDNDIIIPLKVLEEVDKHKKRQDGAGLNARTIIRILDILRESGSLYEGVSLGREYGTVRARGIETLHTEEFPVDLNLQIPDHMIIATALSEKIDNPEKQVIMVTRDINMRVICDSLGLLCEDFVDNKIVKSGDSIFTGHLTHTIADCEIEALYANDDIYLDPSEIDLQPNQFVMLTSDLNPKKTVLTRFSNYVTPLKRVVAFKNGVWGVRARNKEQAYALDLLMNPDISLVTLIGKAGSGKTLCAIAAGIQQILDIPSDGKEPRYTRMIVSRPVQPLGKDIGFLPGTMEEKMHPWLMPIQDNLQFLMGNDKATLEMYMENGTIEIEALTYIRGRSIANAFIIIDEAQNLTTHELKTIITRVGEGTKIVLTGDVEQIDNTYIDATTNGLTHAVEKFKETDLAGHITLSKGERSKVATLAAKIL